MILHGELASTTYSISRLFGKLVESILTIFSITSNGLLNTDLDYASIITTQLSTNPGANIYSSTITNRNMRFFNIKRGSSESLIKLVSILIMGLNIESLPRMVITLSYLYTSGVKLSYSGSANQYK